MKKKIFAIALAAVLVCGLLAMGGPALASGISVVIDGVPVTFDQPPIIEDGRTLVPLRAIFEALGAVIDWEQSTQTVTAVKGDVTVIMQIGNNVYTRNGVQITLDVPPQLVGGRTMVPARASGESFGAHVDWDQASQTVIISTDGAVTPPPPPVALSNGTTPGNLQNYGWYAISGEWIYYRGGQSMSGRSLFRERVEPRRENNRNEFDRTELARGVNPSAINVVGDQVFYISGRDRGIYRVGVDGSGNTLVTARGTSTNDNVIVVGEWIYYEEAGNIMRVGLDGANKSTVVARSSDPNAGGYFLIGVSSDRICYAKHFRTTPQGFPDRNDPDAGYFSVKTDGSDTVRLTTGIHNLATVDGDHLYYYGGGVFENGHLYKVSLSTGSRTQLTNQEVSLGTGVLNADGDYLYYVSVPDDAIYRISVNGGPSTQLHDKFAFNIHVFGDWLYFFSESRHMKMRIDGTGLTLFKSDS